MGAKKVQTETITKLGLNQRLWTKQEATDFFQISRSTFNLYLAQGKIPYVRIGKHIRFIPEQLMASAKRMQT